MKVIWTDEATDQLEGIYNFLARNSELYARQLVDKLVARADALGDFPLMGRNQERYDHPNIRELIVVPYIMVYFVAQDQVEILTVLHSNQKR